MSKILMIPVHLDALYLSRSEAVAAPVADFRGLPYYDPILNRDINSDTPWLGDSAASSPFENSNMTLQTGIHLHWALPDGLCHGEVVNGKIEMPAVPNRWMIRRRSVGSEQEKIWVVESDYLWLPTNQAPAVNIFHKTADDGRPYRFLGRKLTLKEWQQESGGNDRKYLEKLTAIGYGETTFAAYYPNCMTVFGFHDRDLPNQWDHLQYDLIGWYGGGKPQPKLLWDKSVERNDLVEELQREKLPDISQLITKGWLIEQSPPSDRLDIGLQDSRKKLDNTSLESPVDTLLNQLTTALIEPLRRWCVAENDKPKTLMCYASIKIEKGSADQLSSNSETTKIAVGNTASEALTALLANEVAKDLQAPNLVSKIEEQLEALHIEDQLASQVQDLGLRLRRYRHEKSFEPVSGNERWTIHTNPPGSESLPNHVLTALRYLNDVQAKYSKLMNELEQAQRQLYGDWCQYMRCVYRPLDSGRGKFLDIDEVVNYIETQSLAKVEYLSGSVGRIRGDIESTKAKLEGHITQLNRELEQAEKNQKEGKLGISSQPTQYHLQLEPGARFWQPTDLVVLITGGDVRVSDRHGRDGRHSADGMLQCEIYELQKELTETELRDETNRQNILKWLEEEWQKHKPDNDGISACIGFQTVKVAERPWNPLFLDWGIDMHPSESHTPGTPRGYDSDIITENYLLGSQNPDLQPDDLYVNDNPDRLSGRCILGDTPSLVLRERIEDVLSRRLIEGKPESWANSQDTDYFQRVEGWYEGKPDGLPTTPEELNNLVHWYRNRPVKSEKPEDTLGTAQSTVRAQDPLYCTLLAYQKLFDKDDNHANKLHPRAFLGQALSGFNGEMIQWKLGLSLPIDEPIGLTPYREFTRRVAEAVGDHNAWTTEPTNNFSPIRSGILRLDKLRLIDNFGKVTNISCDDRVIVPTPYQKGRAGDAFLPPRLVQPACVKFRWLDVEGTVTPEKPTPDTDLQPSTEMVVAEARSPICGWLLPEKLRGQLLVFAGDGSSLGTLAVDKNSNTLEWLRAPGFPRFSDDECEAGRQWLQSVSAEYYQKATHDQNAETLRDLGELGANLQNRRLARVLLYLLATRSPKFLECFLNTMDDAIANIDPEGTISMDSLALLVGRPVAVVGAELDLQLKDEPAVRQDWDAFYMDQYRYERDTDEFERVQFRLRLGQYQSRNDGVVGYWLEDSGGFVQDTFVAQAADDDDPSRRLELNVDATDKETLKAKINAHDKGDQIDALNFTQSVADSPLQVTLLMDPRGKANLTTGILPVKSIDIPRPLWEPAMAAMQIWFSVAPILSRSYNRRVPIPSLVDRQWSWLELEPKLGLERDGLQNALKVLNLEIDTLIENGWLQKQNSVSDRVYLSPRQNRQRLANLEVETKLESIFRQLYLWQTLYPRSSVDRDILHQELWRLNAELGRVPQADYDLILRGPTQSKNLIIAKKMQSEDENYYLIRIFDKSGKQDVKEIGKKDKESGQQKTDEAEMVFELDEIQNNSDVSGNQKNQLVEKVTSYLKLGNAGYELILRNLQSTDTLPTDAKSLVVARKLKHEDKQYLISIFDSAGHQVTTDRVLTDNGLVNELDNKLKSPSLLDRQGRELTQKILMTLYNLKFASNLGYVQAELIVRNSQSTTALPTEGKNLVIAKKVKNLVNNNETTSYLITIFNGAGEQVKIDQNLTDSDIVSELNKVLEFRELGRDIMSNLGYTHLEIDRLIEKKWLEEMKPLSDRLYVNPKEDRQSLDDWSLETLLDTRLAELSLALVSPGEDVELSTGIEVREGWLLLQSSNVDRKT